jgi:hypothetical protein
VRKPVDLIDLLDINESNIHYIDCICLLNIMNYFIFQAIFVLVVIFHVQIIIGVDDIIKVNENEDKNMILNNNLRIEAEKSIGKKALKMHEYFMKFGTRLSSNETIILNTDVSPEYYYTDGWMYINVWDGYACGVGQLIQQTGVKVDTCINGDALTYSYRYYCDQGQYDQVDVILQYIY